MAAFGRNDADGGADGKVKYPRTHGDLLMMIMTLKMMMIMIVMVTENDAEDDADNDDDDNDHDAEDDAEDDDDDLSTKALRAVQASKVQSVLRYSRRRRESPQKVARKNQRDEGS